MGTRWSHLCGCSTDLHRVVHRIPQGEGGEQGDPLMPLLFAVGQHGALAATQESLQAGERLVAFLDDMYTVTLPERVGPVNVTLQAEPGDTKITVHGGETKVWNSAGERPEACHELERVARLSDPEAIVWRGSGIPVDRQGTGDHNQRDPMSLGGLGLQSSSSVLGKLGGLFAHDLGTASHRCSPVHGGVGRAPRHANPPRSCSKCQESHRGEGFRTTTTQNFG